MRENKIHAQKIYGNTVWVVDMAQILIVHDVKLNETLVKIITIVLHCKRFVFFT